MSTNSKKITRTSEKDVNDMLAELKKLDEALNYQPCSTTEDKCDKFEIDGCGKEDDVCEKPKYDNVSIYY